MYPSAMIHINDVGIKGPCIFYNGALIRDTATGETIYQSYLASEHAADILSFFHDRGWYVQMYCDDKLVVMDDADERCKFYENICGQKAVALGERFWSCGLDSAKMLGISFDKEIFEKMCCEVRSEFGTRIYQATSWNAFIEMVHPSVNKAVSLRRVCELCGVARGDVLAIGDGGNAAERLRWAGTGVAMGNARDSVKEAADIVAPPNTEDGAAQIVEAALAAKE